MLMHDFSARLIIMCMVTAAANYPDSDQAKSGGAPLHGDVSWQCQKLSRHSHSTLHSNA